MAIVVVFAFVSVSGPVLRLLADHFPVSETAAEQRAWDARAAGHGLPFPGHITGVTMVAGVVMEELLFRAPVVAAAAVAVWWLRRPGFVVPQWQRAVAVAAVVCVWMGLSVFAFSAAHREFSALNAATTFLHGIVWGALAMWTRSLLPGVVGHSVNNVLAGGW